MVKQYTKPILREIRATMRVALVALEAEFGIAVEIGNASYTAHEVTFKVKMSVLDEAGVSKEDKSNFALYAVRRGFDAQDFGAEFMSKALRFRITGWNARKWKFPVTVLEVTTGDTWHFPVNAVLHALGKDDKIVKRGFKFPSQLAEDDKKIVGTTEAWG